MQNNNEAQEFYSVDKGAVIAAEYLQPELPKFKGNPLIEALPPINTRKLAMKLMQRAPEYSPEMRLAPDHLRSHMVMDLRHFHQPLPNHLKLEAMVSREIREGYLARNPTDPSFSATLEQRLRHFKTWRQSDFQRESNTAGFAIAGISGIGKTTAIRSVLFLYPQIIIHSHYQGQNFTKVQVVWLRLQCPKDGSTRALCAEFFKALDDLLDTRYSKSFGNKGQTTDDMVLNMASVAANHHLGILVIDEIQNLSQAKSGGAAEMLNFFVQLINKIGLPVIPIGTYQAVNILSSQFRMARRCSGQGDLIWDRMEFDDDWELFIETMWRFQYVRKPSPLTKNLSQALHDVSYGITDLAIRIYQAAQWRAIETKHEEITEAIIRSAYRDDFRLVTRIRAILESGDPELIKLLDDICPPPLIPIDKSIRRVPNTVTPDGYNDQSCTKGDSDSTKSEVKTTDAPAPSSINVALGTSQIAPAKSIASRRKTTKPIFENDDLRGIIAQGAEQNPITSSYQSLLEADFLKSGSEFLEG